MCGTESFKEGQVTRLSPGQTEQGRRKAKGEWTRSDRRKWTKQHLSGWIEKPSTTLSKQKADQIPSFSSFTRLGGASNHWLIFFFLVSASLLFTRTCPMCRPFSSAHKIRSGQHERSLICQLFQCDEGRSCFQSSIQIMRVVMTAPTDENWIDTYMHKERKEQTNKQTKRRRQGRLAQECRQKRDSKQRKDKKDHKTQQKRREGGSQNESLTNKRTSLVTALMEMVARLKRGDWEREYGRGSGMEYSKKAKTWETRTSMAKERATRSVCRSENEWCSIFWAAPSFNLIEIVAWLRIGPCERWYGENREWNIQGNKDKGNINRKEERQTNQEVTRILKRIR